MGQSAHAAEASEGGGARHGAHLRRAYARLPASAENYRGGRDDDFVGGAAGGDGGWGGCATGGVAARATFTAGEILSAFANKTLACQSCVSFRDALKPGMPVRRMPFLAFQNVSHAGSSVTPVPWKSSGGLGNMPCAIALLGCPGNPWHTAQFCL